MSLKKWTILLIAGTTLFLIGITLAITARTLTIHYETQEKISIFQNTRRILGAIDQQLNFLENTSNDWAYWDDTYRYAQDRNPEYKAKNLQPSTFQGLGIDLMILVDSRADVIFSGMSVENRGLDTSIPNTIQSHLSTGDPMLAGPLKGNTNRGLILINGQPMLINTHPILKTDRSGPPSGVLLIGKFLSSELIDNISSLLLLTINSIPVPTIQNDPNYIRIMAFRSTESEPYLVDLTPDLASGYAVMNDIFGHPALILRVDQYPTILNNGLVINNFLAVSLIITALAFGTLLFFLIQFNVLNPISRLSQEVLEIGAIGDIHKRLKIIEKDELSNLAVTINNTLDALDQALFQRQESEERFRTLVESMDDVVFTVEKENKRVNIYAGNRLSLPGGDQAPQIRQLNGFEENLRNQISSHPTVLEQAFLGHSSEYEWSTEQAGQKYYFICNLSAIYDPQGAITSLVGVNRDITRQIQLEQNLHKRVNELGALYSVSQQLLNQVEITNTEQAICQLAIDQLGILAAWITTPSSDGSLLLPTVSDGLDRSALREIPIFPGSGRPIHPAAMAFTSREIQITSLPASGVQEILPSWTECRTMIAGPLMNVNLALAVLVLVTEKASPIDADSLALIRAFMNLSSVAIQKSFYFNQIINGRERLKAVSKRLVEVQEEERRKIALELHDEIGQVLTSLRFSIEMIKDLPQEMIGSQIDASSEIVNELIGRVRQISLDLRPSMLDDLGIVQTLHWFFDRYTSQTGIQVDFPTTNLGRKRFSSNLEITAYRIVQEALTNVARHAKVSNVIVRVWCTEKLIGIQVEDHGVGFDVDAIYTSQNSKGLLGMSERIGYIGGHMDIVSEPGEGTNLTVELPLDGILERRKYGR